MRTHELNDFTYVKEPTKVSKRKVFILSNPSDCVFGIDLSEFDSKEQAYYADELSALYDFVKNRIKDLGLSNNYRQFKPGKIKESVS